jgi:hypothetical protein
MKPKTFYLVLCILGTILPTWQFSLFFLESGFDPSLFLTQPFSTRVGTALVFDLVTAVFAFFAYAVVEGRRLKMRYYWLPIASVFAVGLSLGLPLFLYMREKELEKPTAS